MADTTGNSVATLFGVLILTCLAAGHAQAQRQLVMYCGVDEKWCRAIATTYQKETGVQVDMTRMSAGEVYARVRAEKDNPHGDVWFGGTGDPHLQAADEKIHRTATSHPMLPNLRDWAQTPGRALAQTGRSGFISVRLASATTRKSSNGASSLHLPAGPT